MKTYMWITEDIVAVMDEDGVCRGSGLAAFVVPAGADILPAVLPPLDVQGTIDALEKAQLMPRATREFMLLFMAGTYTPEQLAANQGFLRLKAFDDQIAALRALL
jgi:hypothetical protein